MLRTITALATAAVVLSGAAYSLIALLLDVMMPMFDDSGEPPSEIYLHWLLLSLPIPLFGAAAVSMFAALNSYATRRLVVGLALWSVALTWAFLLFTFWSETWSH